MLTVVDVPHRVTAYKFLEAEYYLGQYGAANRLQGTPHPGDPTFQFGIVLSMMLAISRVVCSVPV